MNVNELLMRCIMGYLSLLQRENSTHGVIHVIISSVQPSVNISHSLDWYSFTNQTLLPTCESSAKANWFVANPGKDK